MGSRDGPAPHPMPVLLLSEDRAQLSLARSHGLPAARLSDMSPLPAALAGQQPLSSSLLRKTVAPAATTGSSAGCQIHSPTVVASPPDVRSDVTKHN